VHRKAQKQEQLLLRVEAGEDLGQVCAELEVEITPERAKKLKAKYEAGGRRREALLDGRYGHHQQVNSAVRAYLYERKQENKELTAGELAAEVDKKYGVKVSEGHINHILRKVALTRGQGRPRKGEKKEEAREASQANAGLFFPGGSEARTGGDGDN